MNFNQLYFSGLLIYCVWYFGFGEGDIVFHICEESSSFVMFSVFSDCSVIWDLRSGGGVC